MSLTAIAKIGQVVTRGIGIAGKTVIEHSPDILVGAGIIGFVGTAILSGKATLKASTVLEEYEEMQDKCEMAKDASESGLTVEPYSDEDYKSDHRSAFIWTAKELGKTYLPVVALGVFSAGCVLKSHHILKARNVALVAAYKVLDEGFKKYRSRVVEEFSEEVDWRFKNGVKSEEMEVVETDSTGKEKKKKKKVQADVIEEEPSGYSFVYDNDHALVNLSNELYIMDHLRAAEASANSILNARGYIFLNEVLRAIGLPETTEGQIVGWEMKGDGDGFVDFGIRQVFFKKEPCFILDFNVDGPIYKNISKYAKSW